MRPLYKLPRLYIDSPLREGDELVLTKPQAHHLAHVLRLKAGAQILLFNGQDGEWLATLADKKADKKQDKKQIWVRCDKQMREQPLASGLVYCFAPIKSARLDYMVQKATEMGASALQPVITQFTQNTQLNLERMRSYVIEAAQQCGILHLPHIAHPLRLTALLENWPPHHHLIFCDETLAGERSDTLLTLAQLGSAPAGLLIGPEGGFSDEEREALRHQPFVTAISLGHRILRTDTAAVAAMALINTIFKQ